MGEKRRVLMSDLFCLFLVCVAVGVFYFSDGSEQVSFFTSSIMNQDDRVVGEFFEEWENDSGFSIDTPRVHTDIGEIQARSGKVIELGRENEARWISDTKMDIERLMGSPTEAEWALAVGEGDRRCREILVSRNSLYRVRQIEIEQSGALEFKISLEIIVTIDIEGDSGGLSRQ